MKTIKSFFVSILLFIENLLLVPKTNLPAVQKNMAKVKLSALVSEMRGKLNGSVFSRNRGGAYLRTKVTPLNPQTSYQVAVRALLTQFAQAWRGLTQTQRDAWSHSVNNWSTTDVFGDVQNPTGNTLYTRLNINIVNAGGSAISTPPSPVGAAALATLSVTATFTGDVFTAAFTPDPVPAGHAMVVEATPMLSPGISNANSQFRQIANVAAATNSPEDLFSAYTAKFGSLIAGQRVFIRAKLVNLNTGEKSQTLVATAIVGA